MAGMSRVGLSPAEMARAGTMSEAKRKRYMKKGGKVVNARFGKFITKALKSVKKKTSTGKKRSSLTPEEKLKQQKQKEKWDEEEKVRVAKEAAKRKAAIAKRKKANQQAKINEAKKLAQKADRSKKTSQVAKRVLPQVSQVRNKLKGMSASDLADKYTGKELKAMEMKLKQATTPNKALLKRIAKARDWRESMISAAETPSAYPSKTPAKWKKHGGLIKRKHGGQGYDDRLAERLGMTQGKESSKKMSMKGRENVSRDTRKPKGSFGFKKKRPDEALVHAQYS